MKTILNNLYAHITWAQACYVLSILSFFCAPLQIFCSEDDDTDGLVLPTDYDEEDIPAIETFKIVREAILLSEKYPVIPFPSYELPLDMPVLISAAAPLVYFLISAILAKWVVSTHLIDGWVHPYNTPVNVNEPVALTPLFLVIWSYLIIVMLWVAYGGFTVFLVIQGVVIFWSSLFVIWRGFIYLLPNKTTRPNDERQ